MEELKWEPCVTASQDRSISRQRRSDPQRHGPDLCRAAAAERAGPTGRGRQGDRRGDPDRADWLRARRPTHEIAAIAATSLKRNVRAPTDIPGHGGERPERQTLAGRRSTGSSSRGRPPTPFAFWLGVKGVMNNITLEADSPSVCHQGRDREGVVRNAEIDAEKVYVAASDGSTVTLSGTVRSWGEKSRPGSRLERPRR